MDDQPAFEPDTTSRFIAPLASVDRATPSFVHTLSWTEDDGRQHRVLVDQDPFLIGRVAPARLVLEGGMVSRRHCELTEADGVLTLTDLGSTNGTFIDGQKVSGPTALRDGCLVTIGPYRLHYQCRDAREVEAAAALDRDLAAARDYIISILPTPLADGAIRTEWVYEPSARLGGDAFGYQMLDDRHFAVFLLDVTGHGVGPALHAVSVTNAIRQRLLPNVDFRDVGAVVGALNAAFPMESHNDLMFTIWYGVLDVATRMLTYAGAGHHPAFLLTGPSRDPIPLSTRNPTVGMVAGRETVTASVILPPAATLCLFSDGVFEVTDRDGRGWTLTDLVPYLPLAMATDGTHVLRRRLRELARPGPLDDDFSFLTVAVS